MALPIITPNVQAAPLPSDIMGNIAQSQQQMAKARFAAPLLRAQLQQGLANIAQVPDIQNLRRAQTAAAFASAERSMQAKTTPIQDAANAYLTSFNTSPHSAQTFILGMGLKKALSGSKGASITTADGTQVTLGGSAGGTGGLPMFTGTSQDSQSTTQPLTNDQKAIAMLFPQQAPAQIQQLPGTSGSRKIAGSTTVDSSTGAVTSRPTRTVTTLNQNSIESAQKLGGLINKLTTGFAPFAGIAGKGKEFFEKIKTGLGGGTPAEQKQIGALNESYNDSVVAATDLMRAIGAPNVVQLEGQFKDIFLTKGSETPQMYMHRVRSSLMNTVREFASKAVAAQVEGILLGKYDPKTRTIGLSPAPAKESVTNTDSSLSSVSTSDLLKIVRGQ